MERALTGLCGVEGLLGSFVIDASGTLLATDVPQTIGHETLRDVGPRILAAVDAVGELCSEPSWCALHFHNGRLLVWPFEGGWLVVMTTSRVSVRALKVAGKIVTRRLEQLATPVAPTPSSAAHAQGGASDARDRLPPASAYRGASDARDRLPPASAYRGASGAAHARTQPSSSGVAAAPTAATDGYAECEAPASSGASMVVVAHDSVPAAAPRREGREERTIICRGRKYRIPN